MFDSVFSTFTDIKTQVDDFTTKVGAAADSVGLGDVFRTPGPTALPSTPPAPTPDQQDSFVTNDNLGMLDRLAGSLGVTTKTVKLGVGGVVILVLLVLGRRLLFKRGR